MKRFFTLMIVFNIIWIVIQTAAVLFIYGSFEDLEVRKGFVGFLGFFNMLAALFIGMYLDFYTD
jgi:hypothetical protein